MNFWLLIVLYIVSEFLRRSDRRTARREGFGHAIDRLEMLYVAHPAVTDASAADVRSILRELRNESDDLSD